MENWWFGQGKIWEKSGKLIDTEFFDGAPGHSLSRSIETASAVQISGISTGRISVFFLEFRCELPSVAFVVS